VVVGYPAQNVGAGGGVQTDSSALGDEVLSRIPGSDAAWSTAGNVSLGIGIAATTIAPGGVLLPWLQGPPGLVCLPPLIRALVNQESDSF
jgi:hypothetical protein